MKMRGKNLKHFGKKNGNPKTMQTVHTIQCDACKYLVLREKKVIIYAGSKPHICMYNYLKPKNLG